MSRHESPEPQSTAPSATTMPPTDRPVADREPLSPEEEAALRRDLSDGATYWIGPIRTARLLATLDAARAHPDEAGLREAVKRALEAPRGTDEVRETMYALERAYFATQPAVPVAGAEDWYDRDAKAFARAHAQTAALRAAQPEDDGLDRHEGPTPRDCPECERLHEGVERRDGA